MYETHGLIGLNFALEPILKGLNRMLLHFFHTKEMAGPMRLPRAWASLAPSRCLFLGTSARCRQSLNAISRDVRPQNDDDRSVANRESGRLHPSPRTWTLGAEPRPAVARRTSGSDIKGLRDEFEHAADAFAQGSLRSSLYNRLRSSLQWQYSQSGSFTVDAHRAGLNALNDHQREASGVRLLFFYMDAIERLGLLLRERLGQFLTFREMADSHPSAKARLARLDALALSEDPPTSPLLRYAEAFLNNIVD
jgi:hypothetical protein